MKNLNSYRSSVMRLAHAMKSDTITFGQAITKAWAIIKMKKKMSESNEPVNFNYMQKGKKVSGLVMTNRRGTTNLDLIPVKFHPKKKVAGAKPRKKNPTQIGYFDFMRMGWRSFSAKNYLSAVL